MGRFRSNSEVAATLRFADAPEAMPLSSLEARRFRNQVFSRPQRILCLGAPSGADVGLQMSGSRRRLSREPESLGVFTCGFECL